MLDYEGRRRVIGTEDVVRNSQSRGRGHFLPEKALAWRLRFPTFFEHGKMSSSVSTSRQRRKETFDVAQEIHGGSAQSGLPGAIGLIDTTSVKCSAVTMVDVMSSSKNFRSQLGL